MAQATGQGEIPVSYEGAEGGHPRFFLKVQDAQIEFVPDASGKITLMVLHQGGRDITAQRQ